MPTFKGIKDSLGNKYDAIGTGTTYNESTGKVEDFTVKDIHNNEITMRGLKEELGVKSNTNHKHDGAYVSKEDLVMVQGALVKPLPEFFEIKDTTDNKINMDLLIAREGGDIATPSMARVCLWNHSGCDGVAWSSLLYSGDDLPVHANAHGAATFDNGEYVILTIYRFSAETDEHGEITHPMCYFVTIDGIFDSGDTSQV